MGGFGDTSLTYMHSSLLLIDLIGRLHRDAFEVEAADESLCIVMTKTSDALSVQVWPWSVAEKWCTSGEWRYLRNQRAVDRSVRADDHISVRLNGQNLSVLDITSRGQGRRQEAPTAISKLWP
nr:hypothetical protein CFP56_11210 [Quercus suber]